MPGTHVTARFERSQGNCISIRFRTTLYAEFKAQTSIGVSGLGLLTWEVRSEPDQDRQQIRPSEVKAVVLSRAFVVPIRLASGIAQGIAAFLRYS